MIQLLLKTMTARRVTTHKDTRNCMHKAAQIASVSVTKKQLPLTRKLSTACATLLNLHPFLTQKACALKTEHFFLGPFRKSCSQGNFRVTDIKVSTHAPKGQLYRFDKPWGVSLLEGSTWGVSLLEEKTWGVFFLPRNTLGA